jgi:hypothetical protein
MRSYPVAGKALEGQFFGGLSYTDLDVFALPTLPGLLYVYIGIPTPIFLALLGVGMASSIFILWQTPQNQRPRWWIIAKVKNHLGEGEYHNNPHERTISEVSIQNEVLTANDSPTDEEQE